MAAEKIEDEIGGFILSSPLVRPMKESFQYMMTTGRYKMFYMYLDQNRDNMISEKEYQDDYLGFLVNNKGYLPFDDFDKNKDGFMTVGEWWLTKKYADAAKEENFELLAKWAKINPVCATPEYWFEDHFTKKPVCGVYKGCKPAGGDFSWKAGLYYSGRGCVPS